MMKRKSLLAVLALCLVALVAVGGTIAYLTANTDPVVNTFTPSTISVKLTETDADGNEVIANTYKVIPGYTVTKDPKVTIVNDDVDAYLFVKVTASELFTKSVTFPGPVMNGISAVFVEYAIDNGWTLLESEYEEYEGFEHLDGVYYRVVTKDADTKTFSVLADDQITFADTLTAADVAKSTDWKLSFDAYAVQKMKNDDTAFTPADAWAQVNPNP